ncbi:MAG: HAMP domain-containing sensor histidine kinase [Candidatus Sumerlaeia bacterium]|nr:HAMP domain-containing sensor histidine kinase [Candidatus Sumerlaeia bacterium]
MADPGSDRLLSQLRWVTGLSAMLGATNNLDDIFSILLSGLLSPDGLGYSSVVLVEVDPFQRFYSGSYALAYHSLEQVEQVAEALRSEESFMRADSASATGDEEEEDRRHRLKRTSQWVTLVQFLDLDGEPNKSFKGQRFPIRRRARPGQPRDFLSEALGMRAPRCFRKEEVAGALPLEIAELLEGQFAVVPLLWNHAVRNLIFVDRRWSESPSISQTDLDELEYFASQCGLAIGNGHLIADLNQALKDLKNLETIKSNFLSTISHELRTPLSVIMGFVDVLRNQGVGPLNNSQATLLERIARNTAHLHTMVSDVIDIAELQIEQSMYRTLTLVDPLAVLMTTLPRLDNRRRDVRCEVQPVIPDGGVPRVLSDAGALSRVFFHLLDNAMKFNTGGKPVRVVFSVEGSDLAITIQDQGIGIPADKLERIFEHFYQVDGGMTRSQEGLGIGLAVVRMLLHGIRGTIQVESEVGKGSAFTIVLPVPAGEGGGTASQDEVPMISPKKPMEFMDEEDEQAP